MYSRKSLPALFTADKVTKDLCMLVNRIGDVQTSKKNKREYRQIFVIDPQPEGVLTNPKEYSRILWGELKEGDKVTFKADSLFNNTGLKVGSPIGIGHVTFQTSDYKIGDRTVNTITVVAFNNEDPLAIANSQLNRKDDKGVAQGAWVVALDGEECPPPAWKKLQMTAQDANLLTKPPANVSAEELAEIEAALAGK